MADTLTVSKIHTARPHPALAAHVCAYASTENHASVTLAALAAPLLGVSWGRDVRIVTVCDRPLPRVILFGPSTRVHHAVGGEGVYGFHLRFTPTGARTLLGLRPIPDTWDDGLPAAVHRWAETIAEAPDFQTRVALTDAFLRSRLPGRDLWSSKAARVITAQAGRGPVSAVAETLGVSERTLRRRFSDDLGIGVKTFAQVARYRQAHGMLVRTPDASWRDVCERFGYADQAHFVRSFRRFSGLPPTRWAAADHSFDLSLGLREEGL